LYAQWLTGQGGELSGSKGEYRGRYPVATERARVASELAGRPVQVQLVALLEKRADFREYYGRLQGDPQFLAKELAGQRVTKNFEARDKALEGALVKEDFRAVETITRPYIEHGMPKKVESDRSPARVVINLIGASEEQKKLVLSALTEEEPEAIDYEIIENQKLLTDGDDD
jgi:hypothetical protein